LCCDVTGCVLFVVSLADRCSLLVIYFIRCMEQLIILAIIDDCKPFASNRNLKTLSLIIRFVNRTVCRSLTRSLVGFAEAYY